MNQPINRLQRFGAVASHHPQDHRVLSLDKDNLHHLALLNMGYQGAVVPDLLNSTVQEELRAIPDDVLKTKSSRIVKFSNGEFQANDYMDAFFQAAPKTTALLAAISQILECPNSGDHLLFCIMVNIAKIHPQSLEFHYDGDPRPDYQLRQAILSLDLDTNERCDQTEWLAINGLSAEQVKNALFDDTPTHEHPLRDSIQTTKSGDLLVMTGLSTERSDMTKYGVLHRGKARPAQRRISFIWGQYMDAPHP